MAALSAGSRPLVRPAAPGDGPALARIYNHYVARTTVTFEEDEVPEGEMVRRIEDTRSLGLPWLVAELSGVVSGYAYAARWRSRSAYRFSAEITVYVDPAQGGRGLGSALYGGLFPELTGRGIHAVMGGIVLPNPASVALHEKFGMKKVAHFKEAGFKFNRWLDVGYWQKLL